MLMGLEKLWACRFLSVRRGLGEAFDGCTQQCGQKDLLYSQGHTKYYQASKLPLCMLPLCFIRFNSSHRIRVSSSDRGWVLKQFFVPRLGSFCRH
ncbi:hypothetical protein M438DRAFT_101204 [Aureobasidium pullulans EXF-150]|uniref:Uncharacterized protein n=1 Tax=Aureobasidium pullulans EXF-150 TaxID=1043002 RepID=A0A074X6A8_AURPU|nr:uncharacterized protein M438DRAFT_101204 [Aureobasidium pullulans EXF-150]KEQ81035.1 hypothetical protein M438DRAFT_101204 [Aureobasidium pullulans EXF-150]